MRIVFMGTGEIALPSLRLLLKDSPDRELVGAYTQPDKKIGRKQVVTPPEVKVLAEEAGIPVFQPLRFRDDEDALETLRDLNPDIIVVMAYGQILPRAVIEAPTIACVNLHASLLPRHRGASPIQAAIREGDEESGITLMRVVEKLDAGDIILKHVTAIRSDDTGGSLHDRLAELGPAVLEEGLPLLASSSTQSIPQDEALTTYAGKLEREDGRINWSQPAETIERLIRAYDPWPGTYLELEIRNRVKKCKIYPTCEAISESIGDPGTLRSDGKMLTVACRDSSLKLRGDLQLEGKKRLPVADFLRGTDLPAQISSRND
jgi:methionyl-tRNA formyltransferase